ncbi:hypothetical protein [Sediminibacillus halophilus]|uniref:Uncharacterized protein n=1 Tax=Sediminibacillus halophilus TaxID=482461 RepID=A0A1G9TZM2_9BACI|nr:hypothetical protein [Sediminibacillus halophilus]SDM53078.1 hypothetical protein SAMN05216244_2800 [Sediminibacillus halophilus]
MNEKNVVSIGGVIETADGYNLHIKGYDAAQHREFNDLFTFDGFLVRGRHIDPRQDPLSAECRLEIKQKIMEVIHEKDTQQ